MKPGDLVKITRASIGVPRDTIGLILKTVEPEDAKLYDLEYHVVQLVNPPHDSTRLKTRRYLPRDLEVISCN